MMQMLFLLVLMASNLQSGAAATCDEKLMNVTQVCDFSVLTEFDKLTRPQQLEMIEKTCTDKCVDDLHTYLMDCGEDLSASFIKPVSDMCSPCYKDMMKMMVGSDCPPAMWGAEGDAMAEMMPQICGEDCSSEMEHAAMSCAEDPGTMAPAVEGIKQIKGRCDSRGPDGRGGELTCGKVKQMYKENQCCGNPAKEFEAMGGRRLTSVDDSDIAAALQEQEKRYGKGAAAKLAKDLMAVTEKYMVDGSLPVLPEPKMVSVDLKGLARVV